MDEFQIFIVAAFGCYCCLMFFDCFFKSCSVYPYLYYLQETGLTVGFFKVSWFTCAFNRQVQKWGTIRPRLQQAWFSAGIWVSVVVMPIAVFLILHSIYSVIHYSLTKKSHILENVIVEPMIPGWNMPSSDFGYYIVSLLISSIVHELGHAAAAVREDVHLTGFSITFFFVIPVAMCHLDQLDYLTPVKKLRVLCAGVWHNIFLAVIAAIVATTLPWLLYPFFNFGIGVQIQNIKEDFILSRSGGLVYGDVVTQLNGCPIRGSTSWVDCLVNTYHEPNTGYCLTDSIIKEHDESVHAQHLADGVVECCGLNSPKHICFEYVGQEDEPLPLPQHSCLMARSVIELASKICTKAADCPLGEHCFRPSLENSTKLLQIKRLSGETVIYLGNPSDIYHTIKITDFIRIFKFFPSFIPDALTKLCQFITIFSSGIALLNIIPCFYFDGQFILRTLIDCFFSKRVPVASVREAISLCITVLGTLILVIYLVLMIVVML